MSPSASLAVVGNKECFLARVLVREPLVLFLDDPFSSIDPMVGEVL
jgi:ABC-type thiamine transport system ATPase subunit